MKLFMLLVLCVPYRFASSEEIATVSPQVATSTGTRRHEQGNDFASATTSASASHDKSVDVGSSRGNQKKPSKCDKTYVCEYCAEECRSPSHLNLDLGTHTGEKPFSCSTCSKPSNSKSHLSQHMKTHEDRKSFSCQFCDKAFRYRSELNRHTGTHTGEKPYSCNTCDRAFNQRINLKMHMKTHADEKPYPCSVCCKAFIRKNHMEEHIRTHTNEKPYSCHACDKAFNCKGNLNKHMRTHTGEKPYWCQHCCKAFGQSTCLMKHMRTHTSENPFSCQICSKAFGRKNHLNDHMRTHTGKKLNSCEICGKTSSRTGILNTHMKMHTGQKPYSCQLCDEAFTKKAHLIMHMRLRACEKLHLDDNREEEESNAQTTAADVSRDGISDNPVQTQGNEETKVVQMGPEIVNVIDELAEFVVLKHSTRYYDVCENSLGLSRILDDAACDEIRDNPTRNLGKEETEGVQMGPEIADLVHNLDECLAKYECSRDCDVARNLPRVSKTRFDASCGKIRNDVRIREEQQPNAEQLSPEAQNLIEELADYLSMEESLQYCDIYGNPPGASGIQNDALSEEIRNDLIEKQEDERPEELQTSHEIAGPTLELVGYPPEEELVESYIRSQKHILNFQRYKMGQIMMESSISCCMRSGILEFLDTDECDLDIEVKNKLAHIRKELASNEHAWQSKS